MALARCCLLYLMVYLSPALSVPVTASSNATDCPQHLVSGDGSRMVYAGTTQEARADLYLWPLRGFVSAQVELYVRSTAVSSLHSCGAVTVLQGGGKGASQDYHLIKLRHKIKNKQHYARVWVDGGRLEIRPQPVRWSSSFVFDSFQLQVSGPARWALCPASPKIPAAKEVDSKSTKRLAPSEGGQTTRSGDRSNTTMANDHDNTTLNNDYTKMPSSSGSLPSPTKEYISEPNKHGNKSSTASVQPLPHPSPKKEVHEPSTEIPPLGNLPSVKPIPSSPPPQANEDRSSNIPPKSNSSVLAAVPKTTIENEYQKEHKSVVTLSGGGLIMLWVTVVAVVVGLPVLLVMTFFLAHLRPREVPSTSAEKLEENGESDDAVDDSVECWTDDSSPEGNRNSPRISCRTVETDSSCSLYDHVNSEAKEGCSDSETYSSDNMSSESANFEFHYMSGNDFVSAGLSRL